MHLRSIILARDGDDDWCIEFKCSGHTIERFVIDEARPQWDYCLENNHLPTLHQSVCLKYGCKSHFLVKKGGCSGTDYNLL